jgi:cytosine/adenosine deaminase-related metal-dependent hydrolase
MLRYIADWVLPITGPPLRPGRVDVDTGRVVGVGAVDAALPAGATVVELGGHVVLPALVNAHTHLELSGLRGRVPPTASMPEWVGLLLDRRAESGPADAIVIRQAIDEARASGTGLFGDIGNTLAAVPVLAAANLAARVFREVLAFPDVGAEAVVAAAVEEVQAVATTEQIRVGLAAHAPFSVGRAAFAALDAAILASAEGPRCIHLAESPEELEFLLTGRGAWRELLERVGRWVPGWGPPACGPVEYLDQVGWLRPDLIVVHGVQLTDPELALLVRRGATLVTCPRSNVWTGVGPPPIERFFRSGVRLAVGTDSLASVPDLNLFAELELMRRLAPAVSARRLLASATIRGAEALGFADALGQIAPGSRAALIAVCVPPNVSDVEEYLVDGIVPDQVTWLEDDEPATSAR